MCFAQRIYCWLPCGGKCEVCNCPFLSKEGYVSDIMSHNNQPMQAAYSDALPTTRKYYLYIMWQYVLDSSGSEDVQSQECNYTGRF